MRCLFLFVLLCAGLSSTAQLRLNEVCSKNARSIADDGAFPDWIELHNAGADEVHLGGLHLSDDPADPLKWSLPDEELAAGGYALFFEGEDNSDGHHFDFKLSQEGEPVLISDGSGALLDSIHVPYLHADHSFGRSAGSNVYYTEPTPGSANSSIHFIGYATPPSFDRAAGRYDGALTVSITAPYAHEIHYTTDGAEPAEQSVAYAGPITLATTSILKARCWAAQRIPSTTTVATYLINEHSELPIISLSTHPDSLFHDTLGLYVMGPEADSVYPYWGANFWDERGIAVRLEYFEEDGTRAIDQEVELRIHGGRASRNKPQRPLRLTARDELGDDLIRYAFFPERPQQDKFKRIILRNSGADWSLAHYRDALWHQVSLHNDLDIDELAYRPAIVFINGAYWGIHNIRERIDEDHLALNYGADRDDLLLMEEENWSIQGDTMHFHDLKTFLHTHDLNDGANWSFVEERLDVESFIDYFALEMFAGNADWPSNNVKYWKPSITEGKWRYLMYDMDATTNIVGWIPNDFDMFYWILVHRAGTVHAEIFRSLMTRDEFKRGFLNRLADLMNTCLSTEAMIAENERIRNRIRAEIPRHFARWGLPVSDWEHHAGELIPVFAEQRPDIMRSDVLEWCDLPNTATLRFSTFPPTAGRIRLNTIKPPLPFSGVYFNENDIDLGIEPAEGFVFDHWAYSAEPGVNHTGGDWRRSFVVDGEVTAYFRPLNSELLLFPSPATTYVDLCFQASAGVADITLHDATGKTILQRTLSTSGGITRSRLSTANVPAGLYIVTVQLPDRRLQERLLMGGTQP